MRGHFPMRTSREKWLDPSKASLVPWAGGLPSPLFLLSSPLDPAILQQTASTTHTTPSRPYPIPEAHSPGRNGSIGNRGQ